MATCIDEVRCGKCDVDLTLEPGTTTVQLYQMNPQLSHFWVYCPVCQSYMLYWPTRRQLAVADIIGCAVLTAEEVPDAIHVSFSAEQADNYLLSASDRQAFYGLERSLRLTTLGEGDEPELTGDQLDLLLRLEFEVTSGGDFGNLAES